MDAVQRSDALRRTVTANLPDITVFLIDHDLRILLADGEAITRLGWLGDDMFVGRKVGASGARSSSSARD